MKYSVINENKYPRAFVFQYLKKYIWNSENNPGVEKYNKTKYYNCINKMLNIGTSKLNSC